MPVANRGALALTVTQGLDMNVLTLALAVGLTAPAQAPAAVPMDLSPTTLAAANPAGSAPLTSPDACAAISTLCDPACATTRRRFESDHAFDGFVNPISNPYLAKDPRANTWARFVFLNNNFPGAAPYGGGDAQFYTLQVNVALTERLALLVDKDGYGVFNTRRGVGSEGWLNLAAGLKYTVVRDVEKQSLFAVGLTYEAPSGEAAVLQNHGSGDLIPYVVFGKQLCEHWHLIGNLGYTIPIDSDAGSSFFYNSWHLDREIGGWLYPLVEFNWFSYTGGGDRLPRAVREGDGLLNLGTREMEGLNLVSAAVGAKVKISDHLYAGAAYEFALTDHKGILNNRVILDLVFRY